MTSSLRLRFSSVSTCLTVARVTSRTPSAIDYSGGQLRLRGLGLAMADMSGISTAMAARGYGVRSEGDLLLVQAEAPR